MVYLNHEREKELCKVKRRQPRSGKIVEDGKPVAQMPRACGVKNENIFASGVVRVHGIENALVCCGFLSSFYFSLHRRCSITAFATNSLINMYVVVQSAAVACVQHFTWR